MTGLRNRIVAETRRLVAFPSVTPVAPGHLLIAPREHVTSLAQLDIAAIRELIGLVEQLSTTLRRVWHPPTVFEHGVGRGKAGGCGIAHAHLHLLPMPAPSRDIAREHIERAFKLTDAGALDTWFAAAPSELSYVAFGTMDRCVTATSEHVPSQFLRRCVARALGRRQSDWRDLGDWHLVEVTHSACAS
jgi:diadenosine tetraphosphate (Ap4A) HIT family hydrolase